jgi:hypothetical protein
MAAVVEALGWQLLANWSDKVRLGTIREVMG